MKNKVFADERGLHMKFYEEEFAKKAGFGDVKEIFSTVNNKGTVRAFHYQSLPKPQQKIVKPLAGKFNVRIIDMENNEVLEYDNWTKESDPIFVKAGNMLGYVALEDSSVMLYVADEEFVGELNSGVSPFSFDVDWKYDGDFTMKDNDKNAKVARFPGYKI